MKFEITKFESVTSTNDVAINLIQKKKKEKGYIYSYAQTNGRGQYGKKWISQKGNLFGSIFFQLKKHYPSFSEFSMINPVIISDVVKYFCKGKNISIKWPNDIFINEKKVCGILQELITSNSKKFLIVGIGINIVSSPNFKDKYQATNIFLETKKKPLISDIVYLTISSYEKFFYNLKTYRYKDYKKKANLITL